MFLMSSSIILCKNSIFSKRISYGNSFSSNYSSSVVIQLSRRRKRFSGLVPNAKKRYKRKKRSWWQKFFFDDDGNWLGLKDEDMIEELESEDDNDSSDEEVSENEKFEAWKRRAEAIVELREAQEDMKNEENKMWEDWIVEGGNNDVSNGSSWLQDTKENVSNGSSRDEDEEEREELFPLRGLVKSVRGFVVGQDDDLLYEDRVFRFASFNSAKFLAVLVLIPWALDFFAHDYVLMPFLDRYVKTVPLASQILDVRRSQKLEMVKEIKLTEARYRLEVEIGQSPSLSEEDLYMELRNKALELRDEWRLRNRSAFANIWSDMVFGVSLFLLLYFNQSKVSLLKFTGYKIINNISDTGKAFLIILLTDIFLGYHSESGWETLLEILVEHYGLEVDQSAITIFVCLVPVIIDACVKLWMFKFLPRLSPRVSTIFQEMSRH